MKSFASFPSARRPRAAFTLIELLTVISVIAILAAILVPTVSVAMKHVKTIKSRVMLTNLVSMSTAYKGQYKVWPLLDSTGGSSGADTAFELNQHRPAWVNVMTGKPDADFLNYNRQGTNFGTFSNADLSSDVGTQTPIDAFGNDDLWLVFNTNLQLLGQIQPQVVNSIELAPASGASFKIVQNANSPINSDCVGLSPGAGSSSLDAVTTWDITP